MFSQRDFSDTWKDLRENCLQAFESIFLKCPEEVKDAMAQEIHARAEQYVALTLIIRVLGFVMHFSVFLYKYACVCVCVSVLRNLHSLIIIGHRLCLQIHQLGSELRLHGRRGRLANGRGRR
jgi:hypothetical protein